MTRERRLAIEMWQHIRYMLMFCRASGSSIVNYKHMFCEQHNLHWMYDCWLCQYMPSCSKCPLRSCTYASYNALYGSYSTVLADYKEMGTRIVACNSIIEALGGEA